MSAHEIIETVQRSAASRTSLPADELTKFHQRLKRVQTVAQKLPTGVQGAFYETMWRGLDKQLFDFEVAVQVITD